jgi:hypothetical protein
MGPRANPKLTIVVALLGTGGCGGGGPTGAQDSFQDGGTSDSAHDAKAPSNLSDSLQPEERVPLVELPRLVADPVLTRRILDGPISLVGGGGVSGCSHGSMPERWCAFNRPSSEGGVTSELWVINVTRAIGGAAVSCEQDGRDCFRLTSNLFTGSQLWGVSHPYDNRFEGDTLIFYADAAADTPDPYVGPAFAWRPGWTHARQLTTDRGGLCFAEHRAAVAFCTDSVVIQKNPDEFGPNLRELDLLVGPIEDASSGPLPKVAHLAADGAQSLAWHTRFGSSGEYFAFSHFSQAGSPETLNIVKTADAGRMAPASIVASASSWEIAHDGSKVYFLQDYDRTLGPFAQGTLMLADFPSGQSAVQLHTEVASFELLGAQDEVFSDIDKGIAFYTLYSEEFWTLSLMPDRAKPSEVRRIGQQPNHAQVATDGKHAVYLEARDAVAYSERTDGSGLCMLTNDHRAETYGTHFSESGRRVFWIEYGRSGYGSEEGWYADPEDCKQRVKYGDYVVRFGIVGDDFVVFTGGDVDDRTSWLQYAPLVTDGTTDAPSPTIIAERPATVSRTGSGDSTFVLYTPSAEGIAEPGLYLFGPLPRAAKP